MRTIIQLIVAMLLIFMIGCVDPENSSPQYSDAPNPHYRPRHDVPLEP